MGPERRRQLLEQRGAIADELRAARDERLVDAFHQIVRRLFLQQAILVAHYSLVVALDDGVVGRKLGPQRVHRRAANTHGTLHQIEVVRRERHRGDEPFQVRRPLRLAVERIALGAFLHPQRDLQRPRTVRHIGGEPRRGRADTHKLFSRGMAERRKRREKLDALDHVGLADRIGADEDGERA